MGKNLLRPETVPAFVTLVRLLVLLLISSATCGGASAVAVLTLPDATDVPAPSLRSLYKHDDAEDEIDDAPLRIGEEEIEKLKEKILQGLGLTKIPDVTKMNVSQEEYERMYGVYLNSVEENRLRRFGEDEEENERLNHVTAQRLYSFTHTEPHTHIFRRKINKIRRGAVTWLYFPIEIPENTLDRVVEIDHATLRLLASGLSPEKEAQGGNVVEIKVYQVLDSSSVKRRLLVDRRKIHLAVSAPKWVEFDVTRATESWIGGDAKNLGLDFECVDCARRGISILTRESLMDSSVSPALNVLVNTRTGNVRDKRSAVYDMSNSQTSRRSNCRKDQRCCRHTMEVVFSDLKGFGFIVQPKKFDAGYCKGKCPPRFNPAHHHALIQSLVWKQNRQKAPKLCCAPYTLSDLEVLHKDENDPTKLKVTKWKDVSVVDCACS